MELKVDNNEATNYIGEKDESGHLSAENLAFLELLLTDKKDKVKEYDKVKKNIQELIFSESGDSKKFKSLIKLVLKGEIPIVKGFFEQEWQNLTSENRDLAINELLALPADKGTTRQATVAQSIAFQNSETAAKIIFHILVGNKQNSSDYDFSLLSKDKKDALRIRFFPQNGTWIPLKSSDNQIFRTLILFFSELAEEVKDFGKQSKIKPGIRLELEFAGWMRESLEKVDFDNENLSKIELRLNRIINYFPESVREQLKQKSKPLDKSVETKVSELIPADAPSTTEISQAQTDDSSEKIPVQKDSPLKTNEPQIIELKKTEPKLPEIIHKKDSQKISDLPSPEQLLKEKQNALSQLSLEIEVLSKLITERDSLLTKHKNLQNRLDSAYDETEKLENKLKDLRRNFDDTEATLNKVTNERDKAISTQKQLSEELSEARKQLDQATKSLESERAEFAQSSKQEVGFEIESFKGELKQKLRLIFENKRQTDHLPNNEKLAEFLRDQFTEIESVLNKSGINP